MNRLAIALTLLASMAAHADEGMWTFNGFPADAMKKKYGWAPAQEWLDHVRLASVRLARGCSASLVSPDGLVLTNHHCSRHCIDQLSTKQSDLVKKGFSAKAIETWRKSLPHCPDPALRQNIEVFMRKLISEMQSEGGQPKG